MPNWIATATGATTKQNKNKQSYYETNIKRCCSCSNLIYINFNKITWIKKKKQY
jgi:hypothetical protein